MKPSVAAALLTLCLVPPTAHAEGGEAPMATAVPPAASPARAEAAAPAAVTSGAWSLGAGVGYTVFGPTAFLASYPGYTSLPYAPTARASIERTLAPRWWLVTGVSGASSRNRADAPAGATYPSARSDASWASIAIGVRRALTATGSPVTVSGLLLAQAGWTATRVDRAGTTPEVQRGEAIGAGLSSGLAVDRELMSGLSLRVSTPLLSVLWSSQRLSSDVSGVSRTKGGEASLSLAPSLELRLAF
ncbi:MAG: hypothetical protein NDI82_07295 [Anaeromyxobacteraceae bacterium]|nr:hypothetical protein [Anaeromyxobacteraceae bacterium]